MATRTALARVLCVSRMEVSRSILSPRRCLDVQLGTLRWGGMTPWCFCSRRLLRVAARNRRPSLASVSRQRTQQSKSPVDGSPRKGQDTIDHKVWVSLPSPPRSFACLKVKGQTGGGWSGGVRRGGVGEH